MLTCLPASSRAVDWQCTPTYPDMKGPFYKEGAPVRNQVSRGYLLMRQVKSGKDATIIGPIFLAPTAPALRTFTCGPH